MPMKVSAPKVPVTQTNSTHKATSSRVDENGAVYASIGGKERLVGQAAIASWTAGDGRAVVYRGRVGAGGYENEGMSLRAFDTQTGSAGVASAPSSAPTQRAASQGRKLNDDSTPARRLR